MTECSRTVLAAIAVSTLLLAGCGGEMKSDEAACEMLDELGHVAASVIEGSPLAVGDAFDPGSDFPWGTRFSRQSRTDETQRFMVESTDRAAMYQQRRPDGSDDVVDQFLWAGWSISESEHPSREMDSALQAAGFSKIEHDRPDRATEWVRDDVTINVLPQGPETWALVINVSKSGLELESEHLAAQQVLPTAELFDRCQ